MSCYKTVITGVDVGKLLDCFAAAPQCFVPTGSRVYGGDSIDSDYDFIVNPKATWRHGQLLNAILKACEERGGVKTTTTPYSTTEDQYSDAQGAVHACVKVSELPDIEVLYIQGSGLTVNLIFCYSEQEYQSWCEATRIMKNLKGRDAERVKVKEARVLAFRVLRRTLYRSMTGGQT